MNHTGSTALFEQTIADFIRVRHRDAQAGRAAIHISDIGFAAQAAQDGGRNRIIARSRRTIRANAGFFLKVGAVVELGLFGIRFTAGRFQVHFADHD